MGWAEFHKARGGLICILKSSWKSGGRGDFHFENPDKGGGWSENFGERPK